MAPGRWDALKSRLAESPARMRAAWHMASSTGLMWELRPSGIGAMVRMLSRDYQNPTAVYTLHAQNQPDRVAIRFRGRSITYAELDERIDRLGSGLLARGLERKQSI